MTRKRRPRSRSRNSKNATPHEIWCGPPLVGGWPTLALPRLRLPHASRFSRGGWRWGIIRVCPLVPSLRDLFQPSMPTPHLRAGLSHAVPSGLGSDGFVPRLPPKLFSSFTPRARSESKATDRSVRPARSTSRSRSKSTSKTAGGAPALHLLCELDSVWFA
jgi:hypothetical protein